MCEAGVNIKAMQDILGHADAETTMDIYAEATKDLKNRNLSILKIISTSRKHFNLVLFRLRLCDQCATDLRLLIKNCVDL